jgi:hypothetical protein
MNANKRPLAKNLNAHAGDFSKHRVSNLIVIRVDSRSFAVQNFS